MSQVGGSNSPADGKYYGQTSTPSREDLKRNAANATPEHLGKAACLLEQALQGKMEFAWCGGWAMRLRGVERDTKEIRFLVQPATIGEVKAALQCQPWAVLSDGRVGANHEDLFIELAVGGQVVAAQIIHARSSPVFPDLTAPGSIERIVARIDTKQGRVVSVIHLTWEVKYKLAAWMQSKQGRDFEDLVFFFLQYSERITNKIQHLNLKSRMKFYDTYQDVEIDEEWRRKMKKALGLGL